ncbi:Major facilitator superfamily domain general substrate transporter [Penicillium chrysogenum]|uniref:Major facilitator superfamily domain general substrate transporter n=1 Tax=Penicillium chrysogenum TaxID=5076 RepID=A0ABQ8WML3_PENCH|nr:Major facilitator superfamily domain general substrate transporter [Penicillium chrysogenum]KAJ5252355.1 Major facilitator superfamily domain general substrate transporter [Penicillium chrysogenum]KAJ5271262.1 Major facilitator superfamily domain general substrate transporter [Penicillium chrysogenum]KAJ6145980.1 Major facilitator superfamily domain general substrate transporter [Penicillium chrysogenum]
MEFNPTQDGLGLRLLSCTSKGHITPREKLVVKLGTMIPVFGCLPFFTKYLDQQAITNAYVSGMKEDLDLHSNEMDYIRAVFWATYYTSMIPACYWLTRTRINIALPTLGIGTKPVTGLFTFGCAWAQNLSSIYAMRFLSGSTNLAPSLASSMSSGHRTSPAR